MRRPSLTLFWRTLLLVLLLLAASLLAWVQSFRVLEREPRARQIAQQMVSVVGITRSALLYSDPALRRELLADLAANEGIRIVPLEPGDEVVPLPDTELARRVIEQVRARLGPQTRLAAEVNGVPGNWVSFAIEDDGYWVFIERDPLARDLGLQWVPWALVAMLLSLVGAVLITGAVNRPLARLARAARELGSGRLPAPLPEEGAREIRAVSASFNRMVSDLSKLEQDRAVLLAGISHDLRTPLTRLRLEIDLNDLPEATRAAMADDIAQMESIVRQFLDYGRIGAERRQPRERIDLSALTAEAVAHFRAGCEVATQIAAGIAVEGYSTDLLRAIDNLLTNAARYGRDPDSGELAVTVSLQREGGDAVLTVADRGPGIAPGDAERLLRPFERGDSARGGSSGAGLGLAIVDRVARIHGGRLELVPNVPHGLQARLRLPTA